MKDYPRHNSRKLLWIFQDSQTLTHTHPDSFAFHSLWHNFTPVVVVGGGARWLAGRYKTSSSCSNRRFIYFHFFPYRKQSPLGDPPLELSLRQTHQFTLFSVFCCFSHSRSSSFLSWRLLWRNESGQVRASQDVRTPVHIYRSAGWGLERLTFMTLGTGYR